VPIPASRPRATISRGCAARIRPRPPSRRSMIRIGMQAKATCMGMIWKIE
jgi:hypothetical protein